MSETESTPLNFIEQIIEKDIRDGKWKTAITTRFPPEPNGYLHIGHVQAIILNYDLAKKYGGKFLVRGGNQVEKEGNGFERTVLVEFESLEAAKQCYESSDYSAALTFSTQSSDRLVVLVEGTK